MKQGDLFLLDNIAWIIEHVGDIDGEQRVLLSYTCNHGHTHVRSIKLTEMEAVAYGVHF